VLTDYHLHLRPDSRQATAERYFTAQRVASYRAAARKAGVFDLGVSEHIYRFKQALAIWDHPLWRESAVDDLEAYCAFAAEVGLRLGIEADYLPGREEQLAALLDRYPFDYVIGSVHFIPRRRGGSADPHSYAAVDMEEFSIWRDGEPAEEVWKRYFKLVGQAAATGLFDVIAHPDLVKLFGPRPKGDVRELFAPAIEGLRAGGCAVELSTAGLRKGLGEPYPSQELLAELVCAGVPIALSSDAHEPDQVGYAYPQAVAALRAAGAQAICVFAARRRGYLLLDGGGG